MMSSETYPSFSEGSQSLAGSATKLEHRVNLIPTLMRTQLTSGLQASLSLLLLLLLPCRTLSLSSQSAGLCVRRVTARTRSFPSTCKEPSRTRSVKVTVKVNRAPASSNNTLGIHQFVCSSVNFLPTPDGQRQTDDNTERETGHTVLESPIIGGSCHKHDFCRDKGFLATNTCLSRQNKSLLSTKKW